VTILESVSLRADWKTQRLDSLFTRSFEANSGELEPLSVFTDVGVVPRSSRDHSYKALGADLDKNLRVRKGDLVFNKLRTWQGAIGLSAFDGIVSPAYFVLRPHAGIEARYYHYLLRSTPWIQELRRVSKYMPPNQNDISWDDLKRIEVPTPRLEDQRRIADFLDKETKRIDDLIVSKRRLIEVLKDRTESMVATMIDPVQTRFGEVPLKSVAHLRVSNVDKKSVEGETPVLLCNYTDVYYNRKIDMSIEFMAATADGPQIARLTLKQNDVLITKDSETADDIGVPALVVSECPTVVLGYHLALLRPYKVDGSYLYWVLMSRATRDRFALAASGVTRFGLRQDSIASLPVPIPPLELQREIASKLDRDQTAIDKAIEQLVAQIVLLQERRQALITAAVTGQLEI